MRDRSFTRVWASQSLSLGGSVISATLLPILAVTTFNASPAWLGAFVSLTWLPQLVLGLPAGAWVDRWCPRATVQGANIVAALAMATIPLASAWGFLTMTHLLVAAAVVGTTSVFLRTAQPALMMRAVPPASLLQANSRVFSTDQAVTIAGPGLAGLVVATVGAAPGLWIDVASYVVGSALLAGVSLAPTPRDATPWVTVPQRMVPQIAEGIALVARDSYLRYFAVAAALANLGMMGFLSLQVLYLVHELRVSAQAVGPMLMVQGLGGVLGALLAPQVARRLGDCRANVVLSLLGVPAALFIPLGTHGWAVASVLLGMGLANISISGVNVLRSSFKQRYVPVELMGRVGASGAFLSCLAMVLAGAIAGILGSVLSVRAAIAVLMLFYVAGTAGVLLTRMRTMRDFPTTTLAVATAAPHIAQDASPRAA